MYYSFQDYDIWAFKWDILCGVSIHTHCNKIIQSAILLVPAWVIVLLVLYVIVVLAYIYVLLLRIDADTTLNWTFLLMLVTL